jgi:hypothetical protein
LEFDDKRRNLTREGADPFRLRVQRNGDLVGLSHHWKPDLIHQVSKWRGGVLRGHAGVHVVVVGRHDHLESPATAACADPRDVCDWKVEVEANGAEAVRDRHVEGQIGFDRQFR